MASIMVSIIIDNIEEDADMELVAVRATEAVAEKYRLHDVCLNEWECQ